jgi:hypothetical protein
MQKLSAYNFVGGELFCIFFFNGFRLSIWFLRYGTHTKFWQKTHFC